MAEKIDIFNILNKIDTKDRLFLDNLEISIKKSYVPLLVMRWMSGTKDAKQVFFINEILNPYVFSLSKHPGLLYKLSTCCSSGNGKRYNWLKGPSAKKSSSTVLNSISKYYNCSIREAEDYSKILSKDDILECVELSGEQSDEITKVKKSLK